MPPSSSSSFSAPNRRIKRQQNLIKKYKAQDVRLQWAVSAAIVVIFFLIVLLGFATDWTIGLRKDASLKDGTAISSVLGGDGTTSKNTTPGNSTATTGTDRTNTNTTTGNTKTTGTTSTTNNTTTSTTTNNTTNQSPGTPSNGLLSLYSDSSAGDNIDEVTQRANQLGVPSTCHNDLLVQVCDFTEGNDTVTVKNLLGSGLVTGVTKNF